MSFFSDSGFNVIGILFSFLCDNRQISNKIEHTGVEMMSTCFIHAIHIHRIGLLKKKKEE